MNNQAMKTFYRVYLSLKDSDTKVPFHILDVDNKTNNKLFDYLSQNFNITFKEIEIISDAHQSTLTHVDEETIVTKALESIYEKIGTIHSHDMAVNQLITSDLNVTKSSSKRRFVNKTNGIILIQQKTIKDSFYPYEKLKIKDNESNELQTLLIPDNESFILDADSDIIIKKIKFSDGNIEYQNYFKNTVYQLSLIFVQLSVQEIVQSEETIKEDLKFSLAVLENYLPQTDKEEYDIPSKINQQYNNVYYTAGSILRSESKQSNLVPNLAYTNDETELDSLIRLLTTSSVPYRMSESTEKVADNRNFIFADSIENLYAYKRINGGYAVKKYNCEPSQILDGEKMPEGTVISMYPTASLDVTPWEFVQTAMEDAWLAVSMVVITCTLLAASTLLPAFIIDQLTSTYIPYGDYYSLIFFGVSSIALLIIIYLIQIIQTRYLVRFEIISDSNLQTMMVDRLLRIKPDSIGIYTPGSLQSRVLGISQLRTIITSNLTPILTAILSVVFNLIYLLLFSWQMALVVAVAGAILAISTFVAGADRLKYFKGLTEVDGEMLATANDAINGIVEIRTYDTSSDYLKKFTTIIKPLISSIFNATRLKDRVDTLSSQTTYILYLFLLPLAYSLSDTSTTSKAIMTTGTAIAFLTCTQTFLTSFQSAIDKSISSVVQVSTYWQRAFDILELSTESQDISKSPNTFDGSIEVSDLSFAYVDPITTLPNVIKGVTFKIQPHSTNLILGESSCGKTTLLSLLSAMHDNYTGKVFISNQNLDTIAPRFYRNYISNVPQQILFMQGSLQSNLSSGLSISKDTINELLPTFYLDEFIQNLPMKLGTVVSPMAPSIPVEYKKKLLLMRSAIKKPKYIFIDDGFSGIKKEEVEGILNYFKKTGMTVIVTSNNPELKELFENTIEI